MKKILPLLFLALLPFFTYANLPFRVGDTLPANALRRVQSVSLSQEFDALSGDKALLIAFMPTDKPETSYGETVFNAFKTYFAQGLTFSAEERRTKKVVVWIVVKDGSSTPLTVIKAEGVNIVSDPSGKLFAQLGISTPRNSNDAATVLLVDKNKTVQYASDSYRGEGEKLKPLELAVKTALNAALPQVTTSNTAEISPLREGDAAPDFTFEDGKKLSDYRGKQTVVVAFYPAPFSGIIRFDQSRNNIRSVNPKIAMGCAGEIKTIDRNVQDRLYTDGSGNAPAILMISASTPDILGKWQAYLKTQSTTLVNDNNYRISSLYQSYNPEGYNNRTVFVVDKQGKLAYIDWEYDVSAGQDLRQLQQIITAVK